MLEVMMSMGSKRAMVAAHQSITSDEARAVIGSDGPGEVDTAPPDAAQSPILSAATSAWEGPSRQCYTGYAQAGVALPRALLEGSVSATAPQATNAACAVSDQNRRWEELDRIQAQYRTVQRATVKAMVAVHQSTRPDEARAVIWSEGPEEVDAAHPAASQSQILSAETSAKGGSIYRSYTGHRRVWFKGVGDDNVEREHGDLESFALWMRHGQQEIFPPGSEWKFHCCVYCDDRSAHFCGGCQCRLCDLHAWRCGTCRRGPYCVLCAVPAGHTCMPDRPALTSSVGMVQVPGETSGKFKEAADEMRIHADEKKLSREKPISPKGRGSW